MIEVSMTRILVVDDSTFNLKIITASLTPSGYEVVTANNGREALDCVDAMLPDLIILDVMMPELNGYEVCRRLDSGCQSGSSAGAALGAADRARRSGDQANWCRAGRLRILCEQGP